MNELQNYKLIDFSILRKALDFYLRTDRRSKIKSPIVKKLIDEVLGNDRHYYALGKIIALRSRLKQDQTIIDHTDFGAGSRVTGGKGSSTKKTVGSFVSSSASSAYKGSILFNLARYIDAKAILELGTNVGLGTAYLASANSNSVVHSIEGCPQLVNVATTALPIIGINNVHIIAGTFSDTIKGICAKLKKIDLVFIDGDHSYEGTVSYYETIKPYLHDQSVVVFDDIYWSDGMMKAWNEIKQKQEVQLSIDVFRLGMIFFNNELPKDELKLLPHRYKFWKR